MQQSCINIVMNKKTWNQTIAELKLFFIVYNTVYKALKSKLTQVFLNLNLKIA